MKTTTIVLIIACSLAFVSAFPLETSALIERRDGQGEGSVVDVVPETSSQGQGTGQTCEHAGAEHAQSAVCKTFRQCLAVGLPDACTEADIAAQAAACVAAGLDKTCSVSALEDARLAAAEEARIAAELIAAGEAEKLLDRDSLIAAVLEAACVAAGHPATCVISDLETLPAKCVERALSETCLADNTKIFCCIDSLAYDIALGNWLEWHISKRDAKDVLLSAQNALSAEKDVEAAAATVNPFDEDAKASLEVAEAAVVAAEEALSVAEEAFAVAAATEAALKEILDSFVYYQLGGTGMGWGDTTSASYSGVLEDSDNR
jgi:hypothetical protein